MIAHTSPSALPARYIWHTALGAANVNCKDIDPSGMITLSQNKKRPAVGLIVNSAGTVLYQDSTGQNILITCIAGQYYQGDFAKILYTGTVTPAETGTASGAITPTAFKIVLYWEV
jgi:hypothetical protein